MFTKINFYVQEANSNYKNQIMQIEIETHYKQSNSISSSNSLQSKKELTN